MLQLIYIQTRRATMINQMFGQLKIGDKFHTGKGRGAGANSDVIMWMEYQKVSDSTGECVKQVGYGNERAVGGVKKFSHNTSVFLIEEKIAS
jgi:hypothetical protein